MNHCIKYIQFEMFDLGVGRVFDFHVRISSVLTHASSDKSPPSSDQR